MNACCATDAPIWRTKCARWAVCLSSAEPAGPCKLVQLLRNSEAYAHHEEAVGTRSGRGPEAALARGDVGEGDGVTGEGSGLTRRRLDDRAGEGDVGRHALQPLHAG